jgi:DNA mismatch repair protein MutH
MEGKRDVHDILSRVGRCKLWSYSEEAKKNLREVIEIQLEETAKLGTLSDFLAEAGYAIEDKVLKMQKEP